MTTQFTWSESDYVSAQVTWLRHHPWKLLAGFWYPLVIMAIAVGVVVTNPARWQAGGLSSYWPSASLGSAH